MRYVSYNYTEFEIPKSEGGGARNIVEKMMSFMQ